jgi:hypothetical protein
VASAHPSEASTPVTRQEFTKAFAKINEGMPGKEVLALLGKPDDIRTLEDPEGITTAGTKEIWCYGTNGHRTFPTLGCVYIDKNDRAQYIFGGRGDPTEAIAFFKEKELRDLLRLLDTAPELNGSHYNPLDVIRIVNKLQLLGKNKALAVIDEYLRVASFYHGREGGLFLVLRVLFDVPKDTGSMPQMFVGAPIPSEPKDPKLIPRFPILLHEDIPLLLVFGYNLGGYPEPVSRHVDYFRKEGNVRNKPLSPPDQPLGVIESIPQKVVDYFSSYGRGLCTQNDLIQDQLFRLIYSVYRRKALYIKEGGFIHQGYWNGKTTWKQEAAEVSRLRFHWDAGKQQFTFQDGSVLPPPPRYEPVIWKVKGFDLDVTLRIDRQDNDMVNIRLVEGDLTGPATDLPSLAVYTVKNQDKLIAEFKGLGRPRGGYEQSGVALPKGVAVQAKFWSGDKAIVSPILKP